MAETNDTEPDIITCLQDNTLIKVKMSSGRPLFIQKSFLERETKISADRLAAILHTTEGNSRSSGMLGYYLDLSGEDSRIVGLFLTWLYRRDTLLCENIEETGWDGYQDFFVLAWDFGARFHFTEFQAEIAGYIRDETDRALDLTAVKIIYARESSAPLRELFVNVLAQDMERGDPSYSEQSLKDHGLLNNEAFVFDLVKEFCRGEKEREARHERLKAEVPGQCGDKTGKES